MLNVLCEVLEHVNPEQAVRNQVQMTESSYQRLCIHVCLASAHSH